MKSPLRITFPKFLWIEIHIPKWQWKIEREINHFTGHRWSVCLGWVWISWYNFKENKDYYNRIEESRKRGWC